MQFTIQTAADLTTGELAIAMNSVYQGYVMPVQVDGDWMATHVETNDIRLDLSPVWREDDRIVGMALVGLRDQRSWIGGFGITPEWRGKRLAGPLLDATLAAAQSAGATRIQLEVISTNAAAIRVYESGGFVITRELGVYQREPGQAAAEASTAVDAADPMLLLSSREGLGGRPLAWQRESSVSAPTSDMEALASTSGNNSGYIVWKHGPHGVQVVDIGGTDAAAISAVIAAAGKQHPDQPMSLLNEAIGGPITQALHATGWREVVRQLEMERPLFA
ncbi:MAG: GNAT family N-acetyltransferase [Thermomicrobiales bacterium]|nr:GNAT family N-acetyltransferase [Thermomicrobiales bacterium]